MQKIVFFPEKHSTKLSRRFPALDERRYRGGCSLSAQDDAPILVETAYPDARAFNRTPVF